MHDDLLAIAATQRLGAVLQEAFGEDDQRIGTPRGPTRRVAVHRLGSSRLGRFTLNCAKFASSCLWHPIISAERVRLTGDWLDASARRSAAARPAAPPRVLSATAHPLSAGSCSFTTSEPSWSWKYVSRRCEYCRASRDSSSTSCTRRNCRTSVST